MTHILLIDDDVMLTGPLRASFERLNYTVSVANDGHTGLSMALVNKPDVIVLDVMMPGLTGWKVCEAIREHSTVPIIMLTALDDSVDRIRGLELGADDYLVKPFGFQELLAHIKAMLRRVNLDTGVDPTKKVIRIGDLEVNLEARTVSRQGVALVLRQKEYDLLILLMTNLGKVVTRGEIFDQIWGTDWLGDTRTLDVHIRWLRTKIEDDPGNPVYLQTIRGIGYRFDDPAKGSVGE
ncbi:MAG: response regulator transcription factor [Anaerolineae bacterium]|nr:response regulator transcription factor [Anaerolineae bacterium]